MSHPHQSFLDEFAIAIKKLSPGVPDQVREQAMKLHAELVANLDATEEQIHDALVTVGKAEFAYRRAYNELVGHAGADELKSMVLDHVEPGVKAKLEQYLQNGVLLDELVKSDLFEHEFTAEERYQVQDGILDAVEHVQERGPKMMQEKKSDFDALVATWKGEQEKMANKLVELQALADTDKKGKDEILDRVKTFEEGWSVVERDPELNEIEKEIEYWKGTVEGE